MIDSIIPIGSPGGVGGGLGSSESIGNLDITTNGTTVSLKNSATGGAHMIYDTNGSSGRHEFKWQTSTNVFTVWKDQIWAYKKFIASNTDTPDIGDSGAGAFNDLHLDGVVRLQSTSDPSGVTDSAHIYAKDVTASSELFVRDEGGTVTQISEHSRLAPDWLYDDEDDIIDRMGFEIQYFQGFVRFTNRTRIGLLASMTDSEKSALTSQKRQCVYQESFADYNTRTGENLIQLDWDTEQTLIQARYDANRMAILNEISIAESLKADEDSEEVKAEYDRYISDLSGQVLEDKDIKKAKPSWLV
mgnify:CR=1 FL=1|tara:strand:+ start:5945 stop:6850 length:906 start_codon:yes stop_codon:yes gene_type:complete